MRTHEDLETSGDRRALAAHAGFGRISVVSVLAGMLVGLGAFAVLAAAAGAVAAAVGADAQLGTTAMEQLGIGGAIATAVILFASWLFGGYVAGRMARRSGVANGLLSLVLALVVAGVLGAIAAMQPEVQNTSAGDVARGIESLGVPASPDDVRTWGSIAGIAALLVMALGAGLGGALGERWHSKLLNRAIDPRVGTEASLRRGTSDADEAHDDSITRVGRAGYGDRVDGDRTKVVDVAGEERRADADRNEKVDGDGRDDHDEKATGFNRLRHAKR